jgi:hypothetical protein
MMSSDSNKTASEIMQSYCVMVNDGSGVLVNAMTKDYTYVLTADHVIRKEVENNVVTDFRGNKLHVLAVLDYPENLKSDNNAYDCAILKVAYQEWVNQSCLSASTLPTRGNLTLVGYPETERRTSDPIKHYDGHMTGVVNEVIILTIDGVPGKNTINGMSGGGVYHIKNGTPLLTGVEFMMDSTGKEQQFGRVKCTSLVRYGEIIKAHASVPMIPVHLESFLRMRDMIFSFNVIDENSIYNLKDALGKFAESLIHNGMPPPYKIMEKYGAQLLVDSNRLDDLEKQQLWVAYLEFFVICALMDNVGTTDDSYIKILERKRRLLYTSDGANWIRHLEELLKIARNLLDKDGTLIVASPDPAASLLPPHFKLQNVINNISVIPNQGPFAIDEIENSLYTSFRLTHLEGLRKSCVVDREDEYQCLPAGNSQLQLLKDRLNEIIR